VGGSGIRYETDDATDMEVKNLFDDVSGRITTYLSRADWEGTWPQSPAGTELIAPQAVLDSLAGFTFPNDPDAVAPTWGAKNGLNLIDLRGIPADDPRWQELLDQTVMDEFLKLMTSGAYNTLPMQSIGKPATVDLDGPAGLNSFMSGLQLTAYPSECVIAATWNTDLGKQMGEAMGEEGLNNNINGWYAPAMNIHRSPFAGRNFEYYSEDGVLSGKIAAAVVTGAQSKGMTTYIKHFALNDQEGNRLGGSEGLQGVITWANEQAMREIYFKPFEIAIKEGGSRGVMSSFNSIGALWAGGNRALMTDLLRTEWGFRGAAITDFNLYSYMRADQGLWAGNDFNLTFDYMNAVPKDTNSAAVQSALRKAVHNVAYATANSNAMNGVAAGAIFKVLTPTWRIIVWICSGVAGVVIILMVILAALRLRKKGSY
jgi:beta-glucosidase